MSTIGRRQDLRFSIAVLFAIASAIIHPRPDVILRTGEQSKAHDVTSKELRGKYVVWISCTFARGLLVVVSISMKYGETELLISATKFWF